MDDQAKWRRRFYIFMAARLFGLATFLAGLAIVYTDLLRPGGWPAVGVILIIVGLIDALAAPHLLKKHWNREDRAAGDRPGDQRADARPPDGRAR